jgi:glycosyltransferase involved in cell wall biosynthesis
LRPNAWSKATLAFTRNSSRRPAVTSHQRQSELGSPGESGQGVRAALDPQERAAVGRPLRVTMVNKYYWPPHLGGVESVLRTLSEGLVEHAGAKVRAIVCNESQQRVEETIGGVEVVRLRRQFALSSAPVSLAMRHAIRYEMGRQWNTSGGAMSPSDTEFRKRPDVFHFHSPYPWGELSFLLAGVDVPSIVLYHSDIVRQKRLLTAYRPFLERFLDTVDLIVASSPNMIACSEFLSPRAEKCRVVPFGLPLGRFQSSEAVLRRAAELRAAHPGRKVVLFVGRLVYYKGVDVLLRAMTLLLGEGYPGYGASVAPAAPVSARVVDAGPSAAPAARLDSDLVLIGSGPLEPELRQLAEASGTAGRVTFLPPQTDTELDAWYHAADVLCLPSVARSEAFGLVQIEAHAAGTPVVSTDLPTGVPYANLDGVTGLIVPPGDAPALAHALARLLSDDELRLRLGHQARERALQEFTVPRMVAGTMQAYAEAIERHTDKVERGQRRPADPGGPPASWWGRTTPGPEA